MKLRSLLALLAVLLLPLSALGDTFGSRGATINLAALGLPTGGDDTAAINNALTKANNSGSLVYAPCGTYKHAGVITITSVRLYGDGNCTVFQSTDTTSPNPQLGIVLTGTNPGLDHVATTTTWAGARQTDLNGAAVLVSGATGFNVDHVNVTGAADVGIFVSASSKGTVGPGNVVSSTLADGIHITDVSSDIQVFGNQVFSPGDDCISVVSYIADGDKSRRFSITSNECTSGATRGITVVGGEIGNVANNVLNNIAYAALYAAAESTEYDVNNITFANNVVNVAGSPSGTVYPAIQVYGRSGYLASDINFISNTLNNLTFTCFQVGTGSNYATRISFTGNHCTENTADTTGYGAYVWGASDVTIAQNYFTNFGAQGILGGGGNSGALKVDNNHLVNINTSGGGNDDGISFYNSGFVRPIITNNTQVNGASTIRYLILLGTQETNPFLENNTGDNATAVLNSGNPSVTSCGSSPSIDLQGTWQKFTLTVGTGTVTSCTITFSPAFTGYDHITVTPHSTIGSFAYSYNKSTLTITGSSLTSAVIDVRADGY